MNLAPIILFVYNRPWHTQQTIEALQKNTLASDSELYIFSDGAKNEQQLEKVNDVRNYIQKIDGFANVTIIERNKNFGLANSVIQGVTEIVNKYGCVIVLEDDLITSPYFLKFMNDALELYRREDSVGCIHGYVYPVKKKFNENFFLKDSGCWGWATWKRAWEFFQPDGSILLNEILSKGLVKKIDFGGTYPFTRILQDQIAKKNNSWAIRWYVSLCLNDKLTLYPRCSLVNNIGCDNSGEHNGVSKLFDVNLYIHEIPVLSIPIKESVVAIKAYEEYFKHISRKSSRFILSNLISTLLCVVRVCFSPLKKFKLK